MIDYCFNVIHLNMIFLSLIISCTDTVITHDLNESCCRMLHNTGKINYFKNVLGG